MATFQVKRFFAAHNYTDPHKETFKPSECFSLEDDITQAAEGLCEEKLLNFNYCIETIDNHLEENFDRSDERKLPVNENAYVINFKYPATLSVIYNLDKDRILSIHGNNAN